MPYAPRRSVPILLLAFSMLVPSASAVAMEMRALRPLVRTGEKAPGFSLKDVDGKVVAFKPGAGKPALIVFGSVFCPTCRELIPEIDRSCAQRGAALRVVGVNLDGKRFTNAIRSFLKEVGLRMPVGLDEIRDDFFIASDPFGVEKTPTVVLVDGDGVVRGTWVAEGIRDFLKNPDGIIADLIKGTPPRK